MLILARVLWLSCLMMVNLLLTSCNPESSDFTELETRAISEITATGAKSGGIIKSEAIDEISAKGVCWSLNSNPTILNDHTTDGSGVEDFVSIITGLNPVTKYFLRAYVTTPNGTSYGDEKSFLTLSNSGFTQIIADHTVVDRFDDIPQIYMAEVKKMWLVVLGESHSRAIMNGLVALEELNQAYSVNYSTASEPEKYTESHLRASRKHWGDYDNPTGWLNWYGEEDWYTNETALTRTKAGIKYCNETYGVTISAIGYGWCSDATGGGATAGVDPVHNFKWHGISVHGPEGDLPWGIDPDDSAVTGNSINIGTYLSATQAYVDFCKANGYSTKVFFTTGPVDMDSQWDKSAGYEGHLKFEKIREFVAKDASRILFDYADILCHDDAGVRTTKTWNGHEYPSIAPSNALPVTTGHISDAGALRLAKAMWWMLARIAGWDGN